jgi:hypothetical protein
MHQPLPSPVAPRRRRNEAGSAYIIALMALVVLTILGLGLALITQTEMQVGANDITMQRVLYAADSGVSRSTARTVSEFDCAPMEGSEFQIWDTDYTALSGAANLRQEIEVSPTMPMLDAPCPLCMINNAAGSGEYGEQIYYDIHHAVTATARRFRGPEGAGDLLAEKSVGAFISLQPWPQIIDCYAFAQTPAAAKVRT